MPTLREFLSEFIADGRIENAVALLQNSPEADQRSMLAGCNVVELRVLAEYWPAGRELIQFYRDRQNIIAGRPSPDPALSADSCVGGVNLPGIVMTSETDRYGTTFKLAIIPGEQAKATGGSNWAQQYTIAHDDRASVGIRLLAEMFYSLAREIESKADQIDADTVREL